MNPLWVFLPWGLTTILLLCVVIPYLEGTYSAECNTVKPKVILFGQDIEVETLRIHAFIFPLSICIGIPVILVVLLVGCLIYGIIYPFYYCSVYVETWARKRREKRRARTYDQAV